jgi:hypothetical protein
MLEITQIAITPALTFTAFIITILVFRKQFSLVVEGISKISAKGLEIESTKQEVKQLSAKINDLDKLTLDKLALEKETVFGDYLDAHNALQKQINDYLDKCTKEGIDRPRLNIIVLAVSMVNSWRFIRERIPQFLEKNSSLTIELKLIWVDPEFLSSIQMSRYGEVKWSEMSRKRLENAKNFLNTLPPEYRERVKLQARLYKNLPHWHGILFNEKYLYLGRVNWSFPDDRRPQLNCGRNKYRYFEINSNMGRERIDLFNNWCRYYANFASELVYDSSISSVKTTPD